MEEDDSANYSVGFTVRGVGNPDTNDIGSLGSVNYSNDSAFTTSIGVPGDELSDIDTEFVSNFGAGGNVSIRFNVFDSGNTNSSITPEIIGLGSVLSYASMSPFGKNRVALLESGDQLATTATGWSPITVTVIPEPSVTSTFVALLSISLLAMRRPRKRMP